MQGQILKSNISKEMSSLASVLKESQHLVKRAGNLAVNAGLSAFNTQSAKAVGLQINLTAKVLKEKMFKQFPARGNRLTASFVVNTSPINAIHFVVNPKDKMPINQKGVPVARRKKIKIKIFRSSPTTLGKSFIAKGLRGKRSDALESYNFQLFRRTSTKSNPIRKRAGVSLYRFFSKQSFLNPIIKTTDARIRVVFQKKLKFLIMSEANRHFKKNVKNLMPTG